MNYSIQQAARLVFGAFVSAFMILHCACHSRVPPEPQIVQIHGKIDQLVEGIPYILKGEHATSDAEFAELSAIVIKIVKSDIKDCPEKIIIFFDPREKNDDRLKNKDAEIKFSIRLSNLLEAAYSGTFYDGPYIFSGALLGVKRDV